MKPRKPIFYDEQRRRWRRTSRVLEICGALFTFLVIIFFFRILVSPRLPVPVPPPVTMKELELMTVPLGIVTLMKPLLSFAGTVALIWELEFTMNAALTPLNVTAVAAAKFAPVRMTLVPAAPFVGEKVKSSGGGLVWPSTLLRKTVATFAGSAVKKVKPVSTSICAAEVT